MNRRDRLFLLSFFRFLFRQTLRRQLDTERGKLASRRNFYRIRPRQFRSDSLLHLRIVLPFRRGAESGNKGRRMCRLRCGNRSDSNRRCADRYLWRMRRRFSPVAHLRTFVLFRLRIPRYARWLLVRYVKTIQRRRFALRGKSGRRRRSGFRRRRNVRVLRRGGWRRSRRRCRRSRCGGWRRRRLGNGRRRSISGYRRGGWRRRRLRVVRHGRLR